MQNLCKLKSHNQGDACIRVLSTRNVCVHGLLVSYSGSGQFSNFDTSCF